ncbi:MAG: prepilin-type N-terminal cleavage/methylation domain-containing protein [Verrucomicrobiota bacterium]
MNDGSSQRSGFTLLEVMLSIAIFLLLITSAFSIVGASTDLITEVAEVQSESAVSLRFVESCRAAFESTNRNSFLEFRHYPRGSEKEDTYLVFWDTPGAFDIGVQESLPIERTVLAAEFQPDGFLRTRVYYLTLTEYENAERIDFAEIEGTYIDLIPRLRQLEWQFFNETTQRWENNMDIPFRNSLVRLILRVEGASSPLETTFFHLAATE